MESKMEGAVVQTGDILLFSGDDAIHHFVAKHTGTPWVQVALVVDLPDHNESCLLECNSRPRCADVERGTILPGVRTVPFVTRVETAEGAVALRRLTPELTPDLKQKLFAFRQSVKGLPFDFSMHSSRRTLKRMHDEFDAGSFICSSLVAAAYQSIGVMHEPPVGPYPNNVWPSDFFHDEKLGLKGDFSFGPLIVIGSTPRALERPGVRPESR